MSDCRTTPLTALHERLGAKIVPFAGYAMPLNYPPGILKEHLHCRARAGLFDVSHMGQISVVSPDGPKAALAALERVMPVDLAGLAEGRQRYGLLTDPAGGIRDDLMAAHLPDRVLLVVNAANKSRDFAHVATALPKLRVKMLEDRALIALQGPEAERVLAGLAPEAAAMRFMDVRVLDLGGTEAIVSRSGYTGEDGYEISVPADAAEALAERLLADEAVEPVGLGARDTLRLEAGLCLHGNDIGPDTTPVEAGLTWAIQKVRRSGGAREGGFPGARRILAELAEGTRRLRVGLLPEGRAPVRGHTPLYAAETGGAKIGEVTSGGFGPSLGRPVAMGYVPAELAEPGTTLWAEVRGKRLPITTAATPFVPNTYKR
ncbi:glycine cleavage system aminomethyltransferase GcvT [Paralimibaculum aggregatum]|uniref:glycine cleavage system aminomethyltransferase GcvT n=1 Tax=Paralimibaculum aggregatum TaxID=3036245 RepID=UPI0025547EC3|nr:glycine cleavage system aminomethyltransferase GcvT [Limibaculum sp. NKW23]